MACMAMVHDPQKPKMAEVGTKMERDELCSAANVCDNRFTVDMAFLSTVCDVLMPYAGGHYCRCMQL